MVHLPIQATSLLRLSFEVTTNGNITMCVHEFVHKPTPETGSGFVARSLVGQECLEELFFPCSKPEITNSTQN